MCYYTLSHVHVVFRVHVGAEPFFLFVKVLHAQWNILQCVYHLAVFSSDRWQGTNNFKTDLWTTVETGLTGRHRFGFFKFSRLF